MLQMIWVEPSITEKLRSMTGMKLLLGKGMTTLQANVIHFNVAKHLCSAFYENTQKHHIWKLHMHNSGVVEQR